MPHAKQPGHANRGPSEAAEYNPKRLGYWVARREAPSGARHVYAVAPGSATEPVPIIPGRSESATVPDSSTAQSNGLDVAAADMAEVDRVIRERLSSEVALIDQIGGYIV